jgi:hypothetical protein
MGFFLFLLLFILVLGLALIGSVLNFIVRIFSFGRKGHSADTHQNNTDESSRQGKKVFSKEEGEYVDFEEVKK